MYQNGVLMYQKVVSIYQYPNNNKFLVGGTRDRTAFAAGFFL